MGLNEFKHKMHCLCKWPEIPGKCTFSMYVNSYTYVLNKVISA